MTRNLLRAGALLASLWLSAASPLRAQSPTLVGPTTTCVGQTDTFTVTNPPPGGVNWDVLTPPIPARILTVNDTLIIVQWLSPGSYTLGAQPRETGPDLSLVIEVAGAGELTLGTADGIDCTTDGANCLTFCLGTTATFTSSTLAEGSLTWTVTGSATLLSTSGPSAIVDIAAAGDFEITVTLTTPEGCEITATRCGRVKAPIALTIEHPLLDANDVITVCGDQRLQVGFAPALPPGATTEWRLSDGTTSLSPAFDHVFTTPGTYTLDLFATHDCGCYTLTDRVTVVVEPGERFEFICPPVVCAGETVDYFIDRTRGQGRYCTDVTWSFVGAASWTAHSSTHYTVTWPTSGSATGQVIVTPIGCPGCPVATVLDVPILGGTSVAIAAPQVGNCAGASQQVVAPNIPGASYVWDLVPGPHNGSVTLVPQGNAATVVFAAGSIGHVVEVRVEITSEVGQCSSTATRLLAHGPAFTVEPTRACPGESITLRATPTLTGSIGYTFGTQVGRWDFGTGDLVLGPAAPGTTAVVLSDLEVLGAEYPHCSRRFGVTSDPVPEIVGIVGPREVCAQGTYLYAAQLPPGFTGEVRWTIAGGEFVPGGAQATGQQVVVRWDGTQGVLTATPYVGECAGTPVEIVLAPATEGEVQIVASGPACVDTQSPTTYTLVCGSSGSPCGGATNVAWTIDPALGTIISGQNTPEITVQWHLPLGINPTAVIRAVYTLCDGEVIDDRTLEVSLQVPNPVTITVEPAVACAGERFVFTAVGNPNLTVDQITWRIQDFRGATYTETVVGGATTYNWNSATTIPEVTAGIARVSAVVVYEGCGFRDFGTAAFEIVFNPIPVLSFVEREAPCDSLGNPQAVAIDLITSVPGTTGGAASTTYTWQRNCGQGYQTFATTTGTGRTSVTADPNAPCLYRVIVARATAGLAHGCTRTSNPLGFTWPCEGGCAFEPTLAILDVGGYDPDGQHCGEVTAIGGYGQPGTASQIGLTWGAWSVLPSPVPPLTDGPITRTDPNDIDGFSNGPWPFAEFQQAGIYHISYAIGNQTDTCEARTPVEITLVPKVVARVVCHPTESQRYNVFGIDHTEVISGAMEPSRVWELRDASGNAVQPVAGSVDQWSIEAPTISTIYTLCLTASTLSVEVNPGTPYTCHVCEEVFIPAAPIAAFAPADERVCAQTSFQFSYIEPNDAFSDFVWDFGDQTGSTLPHPTKTYANPGTYTIRLSHTNSIGCTAESLYELEVAEGPVSGQVFHDVDACGTSATLWVDNLQGAEPFSFNWSPLTADEPSITVTQTGLYSLVLTDARGCRYTTPPVAVSLAEAFTGPISIESPLCLSGAGLFIRMPVRSGFTYYVSFDGAPPTLLFGNNYPAPASGSAPGAHTVRLEARLNNGTTVCAVEEATYTVSETPAAPEIALQNVICEPVIQLTYGTVDGRAADWFIGGNLVATGATVVVGPTENARQIFAIIRGNFCSSAFANALVPKSLRPSVVEQCFTDCEDLPGRLRDLSEGTYATWEWVFIPEGETSPAPACPGRPGPGTGRVLPWINFNCGDGEYFLRVTTNIGGTICTLESGRLIVNCDPPVACDIPEWVAQDISCMPSDFGIEYYINFHGDAIPGDGAPRPCMDDITLAGATFVGGTPQWTAEFAAFNVEGRIVVNPGVNLADVCLTIPYCDNAGRMCGSEVVCLGEATDLPNPAECNVGCGSTVTYGEVEWRCAEDGGAGQPYLLELALENVQITLPAGCDPHEINLYTVSGQLVTGVGPGINVVAPTGYLQGTLSGNVFTIPSLEFGYTTWSNQRQACFNVVFIDCRPGNPYEGPKCAVNFCLDVPVGCFPPPRDPSIVPLVECGPAAEGFQEYEVWLPLGVGEIVPANPGVLGLTAGGTGVITSVTPDAIRVLLSVPAGSTSTWLLLGDTTLARGTISLTAARGAPETVEMPEWLNGDIVRHIWLPQCPAEGAPTQQQLRISTGGTEATGALTLEVGPNPVREQLHVHLTGGEGVSEGLSAVEADWSTLRVSGVAGAVTSGVNYAGPRAARDGILQVSRLPAGVYFIVVRTTDGRSVGARFVKQ